MNLIPSQGLRHAATLLLTHTTRAIPVDASPETVRAALGRLAHELVSLADDMRAPAETAAWLIAELSMTVDRLPQSFDRAGAKADATEVLARVASRAPHVDRRDLFLIYVPEDRLPVAAPIAVELAKRRVSVAFAEYEVGTAEQFRAALVHGLAHHGGGVIFQTRAFDRGQWPPVAANDRLRIVDDPLAASAITDLVAWASRLRLSNP